MKHTKEELQAIIDGKKPADLLMELIDLLIDKKIIKEKDFSGKAQKQKKVKKDKK
ncbi:MAG: hypothetical protein P9L97_06035 [Candidatus Tenebribacter davisii]|nr:hypothetical protein [Candidatus Tenebribacter davisii]